MKARTFLYAGCLLGLLVACQNDQSNKVVAMPDVETTSPAVDVPQMPAAHVDPMSKKKSKQPKANAVSANAVVFANKTDDVCGMEVEESFTDTCHYKGKVYAFCSEFCKDKFKSQPLKYLSGK
jgi:YHS domain-containing protein